MTQLTIKKLWDDCMHNPKLIILLLIVFFPVGLYGMWNGEHFSSKTRWVITIFLCWWGLNLLGSNTSTVSQTDCTTTYQMNGCTYYRDDNCNVIARRCE